MPGPAAGTVHSPEPIAHPTDRHRPRRMSDVRAPTVPGSVLWATSEGELITDTGGELIFSHPASTWRSWPAAHPDSRSALERRRIHRALTGDSHREGTAHRRRTGVAHIGCIVAQ